MQKAAMRCQKFFQTVVRYNYRVDTCRRNLENNTGDVYRTRQYTSTDRDDPAAQRLIVSAS